MKCPAPLVSTLCLVTSLLGCHSARPASAAADVGDELRRVERERIRVLVVGDTVAAGPFHSPDFQLVNPVGRTQTRADYFAAIASRQLDYVLWEPDSIVVRAIGTSAVLRYRSRLIAVVRGDTIRPFGHWHTDLYERRDGRWQLVWSQATATR